VREPQRALQSVVAEPASTERPSLPQPPAPVPAGAGGTASGGSGSGTGVLLLALAVAAAMLAPPHAKRRFHALFAPLRAHPYLLRLERPG
jgi:hypothetical protein